MINWSTRVYTKVNSTVYEIRTSESLEGDVSNNSRHTVVTGIEYTFFRFKVDNLEIMRKNEARAFEGINLGPREQLAA